MAALRTAALAALSLASLGTAADESPVDFTLDYTAEGWTTLGGSARSGSGYLDNLDAVLEADLEALLGWRSTRAVLYALYNNGHEFGGRYLGDLQGLSNIETGVEALRLFEAFVETGIGRRGSLLVGLFDLNSEFDVLDTSDLFLHSAHGIGTDFGQTGVAGPSIFPVSSLALRYEHDLGSGWRVRGVALDAVPGDPDDPGATAIHLDRDEGALLVAEIEHGTGTARLLAGAWRYTAAFPDELASSVLGRTVEERGNQGLYLRGEWRPGDWSFFARLGRAEPRFNPIEWYLGLGVVYEAGLPFRRDDRIGFALALAEASSRHRRAAVLAGDAVAARELAFEVTWEMPLGERVVLQPDLQYIVNPGLDADAGHPWALGLRLTLSLR